MQRRVAITVRGVVQGVGFRPFVYNAASAENLCGWVANQSDAVRIEVEGTSAAVARFLDQLRHHPPRHATISQIDIEPLPAVYPGVHQGDGFEIRESDTAAQRQPTIPPDLATCSDCLAEITDPTERRYHYPFTNCTNCGPRWSILTGLPYDRRLTSMHTFKMCEACRNEYTDPTDRRFHAQPIACPDCGPQLQLLDSTGCQLAAGHDALLAAVAAIVSGAIVALKGLGGFQLIADAMNGQAVSRLRQRKQRPDKPLAVMFADLQMIATCCDISAAEKGALASAQAPILLVRKKLNTTAVAEQVAPGNPYLGVMIPNTPLHSLLLQQLSRPVVCTSGNRSEEPMATDVTEALERLADIADLILTHDRPIVRPVDDSVCRVDDGKLQVLRRARGFAPLPLAMAVDPVSSSSAPTVLGVGGHLKNTVALSLEENVIVGSHVGDLDNSLSLEVHRRAINDLVDFFQATPDVIACDLHPDYSSTQHAERLAAQWQVPLVRIQHHHAHVLAAMVEHQLTESVLGFAWDGTGFGSDGTIWGGEAILVERHQWQRVAHLRTFALPGGDLAARQPRRSAIGLLHSVQHPQLPQLAKHWFTETELKMLFAALTHGKLFPQTSSMGRLFDAVAALCNLPVDVSFEGQAAMQLEFIADHAEQGDYDFPLSDAEPAVADTSLLVQRVLDDLAQKVAVGTIAARFHNSLARLALQIAQRIGCPRVVLTGGCFQNQLLATRARACLSKAGFEVYTQRRVPPGDGGIAVGQVLGARHQVGG